MAKNPPNRQGPVEMATICCQEKGRTHARTSECSKKEHKSQIIRQSRTRAHAYPYTRHFVSSVQFIFVKSTPLHEQRNHQTHINTLTPRIHLRLHIQLFTLYHSHTTRYTNQLSTRRSALISTPVCCTHAHAISRARAQTSAWSFSYNASCAK